MDLMLVLRKRDIRELLGFSTRRVMRAMQG